MVQQVWTYNGEPFLIWNNRDLPEQYTTIPPEDGMYYPIRFDEDENKWIGSEPTESPSEDEQDKEAEQYIPNENEMMLAKAQMQVTKTANQLVKSQKEQAKMAMELVKKEQRLKQNEIIQAQTMKELTAKEQRLKDMEMQQAKAMLEITKMKGSN